MEDGGINVEDVATIAGASTGASTVKWVNPLGISFACPNRQTLAAYGARVGDAPVYGVGWCLGVFFLRPRPERTCGYSAFPPWELHKISDEMMVDIPSFFP